MEKLALTLEQAAESIQIGIPAMRVLIHQPEFPAFRVGKRWVIPVDAFQQWMQAQAFVRATY